LAVRFVSKLLKDRFCFSKGLVNLELKKTKGMRRDRQVLQNLLNGQFLMLVEQRLVKKYLLLMMFALNHHLATFYKLKVRIRISYQQTD